ncbi:hypothetical protein D779_1445 [Imhoffiella purpurea]|uniref:Uncharacterized protein n=1 Tax=Imhoffiella purpurea TaxID=1249627 RepID=W9V7H1_9GAMM|nr:hypothetical protein D779_1445 [Imhoffiella purpurea]
MSGERPASSIQPPAFDRLVAGGWELAALYIEFDAFVHGSGDTVPDSAAGFP